eukprot:scaffold6475_cov108-Isochrysis_galbana.AAC.3
MRGRASACFRPPTCITKKKGEKVRMACNGFATAAEIPSSVRSARKDGNKLNAKKRRETAPKTPLKRAAEGGKAPGRAAVASRRPPVRARARRRKEAW